MTGTEETEPITVLTDREKRRARREIAAWEKRHPGLEDLCPEVYAGRSYPSRSELYELDYKIYGPCSVNFRFPVGPRLDKAERLRRKLENRTRRFNRIRSKERFWAKIEHERRENIKKQLLEGVVLPLWVIRELYNSGSRYDGKIADEAISRLNEESL